MITEALTFACGKSFSDWKNSYRVHFDSNGGYNDVETARANPPPGYDIDRWNQVVDHFLTDAYIRRSDTNKRNRSKQKYPSFHGSKSFSARRFEVGIIIVSKVKGIGILLIVLFLLTGEE